MIEFPIGVLLFFLALIAALAAQAAALQRRLDAASRTIERQTKTIRRQMQAIRQVSGGLDPGRELANDFGPGRRDLTAFFAEWGRLHLRDTDSIESPNDPSPSLPNDE